MIALNLTHCKSSCNFFDIQYLFQGGVHPGAEGVSVGAEEEVYHEDRVLNEEEEDEVIVVEVSVEEGDEEIVD